MVEYAAGLVLVCSDRVDLEMVIQDCKMKSENLHGLFINLNV